MVWHSSFMTATAKLWSASIFAKRFNSIFILIIHRKALTSIVLLIFTYIGKFSYDGIRILFYRGDTESITGPMSHLSALWPVSGSQRAVSAPSECLIWGAGGHCPLSVLPTAGDRLHTSKKVSEVLSLSLFVATLFNLKRTSHNVQKLGGPWRWYCVTDHVLKCHIRISYTPLITCRLLGTVAVYLSDPPSPPPKDKSLMKWVKYM